MLENKAPRDLAPGDHIVINDMLFRVQDNFRVAGGVNHRMLRLAFHTHADDKNGSKFHEIKTESKIMVFRLLED
jgi:hypothetical protein